MNEPMNFELSPRDVQLMASYLEDLKAENDCLTRLKTDAYHQLQREHQEMQEARERANQAADDPFGARLTPDQAIGNYIASEDAYRTARGIELRDRLTITEAPSIYTPAEQANITRVTVPKQASTTMSANRFSAIVLGCIVAAWWIFEFGRALGKW